MDVVSWFLLNGPVSLLHDFVWPGGVEPAIAALRRYIYLCRNSEFLALSYLGIQRSGRQIQALRAHDALATGASIRDIDVMLFGIDKVLAEWPGQGEALKSKCRHMIALARFMTSGGCRTLLRRRALTAPATTIALQGSANLSRCCT